MLVLAFPLINRRKTRRQRLRPSMYRQHDRDMRRSPQAERVQREGFKEGCRWQSRANGSCGQHFGLRNRDGSLVVSGLKGLRLIVLGISEEQEGKG